MGPSHNNCRSHPTLRVDTVCFSVSSWVFKMSFSLLNISSWWLDCLTSSWRAFCLCFSSLTCINDHQMKWRFVTFKQLITQSIFWFDIANFWDHGWIMSYRIIQNCVLRGFNYMSKISLWFSSFHFEWLLISTWPRMTTSLTIHMVEKMKATTKQ